jgi:hypothetical protein
MEEFVYFKISIAFIRIRTRELPACAYKTLVRKYDSKRLLRISGLQTEDNVGNCSGVMVISERKEQQWAHSSLRHHATWSKGASSIYDKVIPFFDRSNPSSSTMVLVPRIFLGEG